MGTGRKRKGKKDRPMRCPYCGGPVVYRSSKGIYRDGSRQTMLYVCANYPACDAYVRVHEGTRIPVGSLADWKLRKLRREAHRHFNRLYDDGHMSRQDAYRWLADITGAPPSEAHIGHMGEYYCQFVIDKSDELMERRGLLDTGRPRQMAAQA